MIYITMCLGGAAGLLMGGVLGRWTAGSVPELARRITDVSGPGPATPPQDVGMVVGSIAGLLLGLALTVCCFVVYIMLLWISPRRGAMQAAMTGAAKARSGRADQAETRTAGGTDHP